jgi:hypothetical protein
LAAVAIQAWLQFCGFWIASGFALAMTEKQEGL